MSRVIWKFPLEVTDMQTVALPRGADILTVQVQYDKPCLWALVDPDAARDPRWIEIIGTGNPIAQDMGISRHYIATFQLHGGELVFHAFERTD